MGWVKTQPCVARFLVVRGNECGPVIHAHHMGGRYDKAGDRNCVPLCFLHHADWHGRVGGGGVFAGWPLERKRAWGRDAIAATLATWEAR